MESIEPLRMGIQHPANELITKEWVPSTDTRHKFNNKVNQQIECGFISGRFHEICIDKFHEITNQGPSQL